VGNLMAKLPAPVPLNRRLDLAAAVMMCPGRGSEHLRWQTNMFDERIGLTSSSEIECSLPMCSGDAITASST
jgi:hypothetical protein